MFFRQRTLFFSRTMACCTFGGRAMVTSGSSALESHMKGRDNVRPLLHHQTTAEMGDSQVPHPSWGRMNT